MLHNIGGDIGEAGEEVEVAGGVSSLDVNSINSSCPVIGYNDSIRSILFPSIVLLSDFV